jgi:hypothetical protein
MVTTIFSTVGRILGPPGELTSSQSSSCCNGRRNRPVLELEIRRRNVAHNRPLPDVQAQLPGVCFSNRFKAGFSMPVQNCTREPMSEKPNSIRMRVGSPRAKKRASRQNARDQQGTRAYIRCNNSECGWRSFDCRDRSWHAVHVRSGRVISLFW